MPILWIKKKDTNKSCVERMPVILQKEAFKAERKRKDFTLTVVADW